MNTTLASVTVASQDFGSNYDGYIGISPWQGDA